MRNSTGRSEGVKAEKWTGAVDILAHATVYENLAPKSSIAAKWSEVSVQHAVIPWVGLRFTFHLHFSCPASQMTNPSIVFDDVSMTRGFPVVCQWAPYNCPSIVVRVLYWHSITITYNVWQRHFARGCMPWVTNCSRMILRKTCDSDNQCVRFIFILTDGILIFLLEQAKNCGKWSDSETHTIAQQTAGTKIGCKTRRHCRWNQAPLYFYSSKVAIWFVWVKSYQTVPMILRSMPGLWPYESFFRFINSSLRQENINEPGNENGEDRETLASLYFRWS